MVIGVCGFGYSGSGAVMDLLNEYDGIKTLSEADIEFSILYRPDGLTDLEYHVENPCRYFASDVAIERFRNKIKSFFKAHHRYFEDDAIYKIMSLTDDYLSSISYATWKGWWSYDIDQMDAVSLFIYKLLNKLTAHNPKLNIKLQKKFYYRDMHLAVKPEDFMEITQRYVKDLLLQLGLDIEREIVLLNQVFAADNPTRSSVFFKNKKIIVVDKDPRDLYLLLKRESFKGCSWTPTGNVDDYIGFYEGMRRGYEDIDRSQVLLVKIEDMIYEYDNTIAVIENYLGLNKEAHVHPLMYFDPKKSINNTQLFRKYPDMKGDIAKIEERLEKYLFDFDKYPVMKSFGKTF